MKQFTLLNVEVIFGSEGAANPNTMANIQAQLFQEHGISSLLDLKSLDVIYTLTPAPNLHRQAPNMHARLYPTPGTHIFTGSLGDHLTTEGENSDFHSILRKFRASNWLSFTATNLADGSLMSCWSHIRQSIRNWAMEREHVSVLTISFCTCTSVSHHRLLISENIKNAGFWMDYVTTAWTHLTYAPSWILLSCSTRNPVIHLLNT